MSLLLTSRHNSDSLGSASVGILSTTMAEIYPGLTLAAYQAKHPEEFVNGSIKVCVGGGAGFIGSHIAKRLKEAVSSYHEPSAMS